MVCNLKVRRSQAAEEEASPYRLQISAKHAVGGAGGLISDELRYASLPDLFKALDDLRLPGDLLLTAQLTEDLWKAEDRWLLIAHTTC